MDYVPDPKTGLRTEEYVDVYGIPFSVIPFNSGFSYMQAGPAILDSLPRLSSMDFHWTVPPWETWVRPNQQRLF
jgi:hypothetical protein